jgi:CheY-like chemotaxis protein
MLGMPQMDGYELLENVRRLETEIGWLPTIAFTASAREEDRLRTRQANFQAHLTKPVTPWRVKFHTGPARLGKPDGYRLLGRPRSVPPFTYMLDLFPDKFPCLCGSDFPSASARRARARVFLLGIILFLFLSLGLTIPNFRFVPASRVTLMMH